MSSFEKHLMEQANEVQKQIENAERKKVWRENTLDELENILQEKANKITAAMEKVGIKAKALKLISGHLDSVSAELRINIDSGVLEGRSGAMVSYHHGKIILSKSFEGEKTLISAQGRNSAEIKGEVEQSDLEEKIETIILAVIDNLVKSTPLIWES